MTQRSLITGAAGLVGAQTVIELLGDAQVEHEIHCTLHSAGSKERLATKLEACGLSIERVVCHWVDLEDFAAVNELIEQIEPNVVYHTAAQVSLDEADGSQMVRRNVDMTHFLVEALLALKNSSTIGFDPLLVHVSSVAALGNTDSRGKIDHNTPFVDIASASAYARSKFLSQNDVLRAFKLGLNVVIVNPSVIIGIDILPSKMRTLFSMIARQMNFYTSGQMGYVDVRDVARSMVLLAKEPKSWGEIYILNGSTLTFREFITIFGSLFSRRAPRIGVANWAVKLIEWSAWGWSRIFGGKALIPRGYLTLKRDYDGSRIEHTLPHFKYRPIEQTAIYIAHNL